MSRQDWETPPDLMAAVIARFGPIYADLAANASNRKASVFLDEGLNSLAGDWPTSWEYWLNPPFGNIAPWAAKCAQWAKTGTGRIRLLVPASIGSRWFSEHVHDKALVLALQPRLTFVGATAPYPKDCML